MIFDEWGRILGVSESTFKKIVLKYALEEFGMVLTEKQKKVGTKMQQMRENLIKKIGKDDNAKLFKKTITMNNLKGNESNKRTYVRPSDLLLKFGSIQHFLP